MELNKIYQGNALDVLRTFPDKSINCCVTSPPYYGLRDYGAQEQIGNEETPDEYINNLVTIFNEINRVLTDDGTLWLNIGDSYAGSSKGRNKDGKPCKGHSISRDNNTKFGGTLLKSKVEGAKPKDLIGIPWMLAFALRDSGWYLRQDIIWAKGNPMPESVKDRCTKSHEYIFLLSKSRNYYFDNDAIKETAVTKPKVRNKNAEGYQADYPNGNRFSEGERIYGADRKRNKRDVWFVNTKPCKEAHFCRISRYIDRTLYFGGVS